MTRPAEWPVLWLRAEFFACIAPKDAAVFFAKADTPPIRDGRAHALLVLAHGAGDEPPVTLVVKHSGRKVAEAGLYRISFIGAVREKAARWTHAEFDLSAGVQELGTGSARSMARELQADLSLVAGIACSLKRMRRSAAYDVSFLYEPGSRRPLDAFPQGVIVVGGLVLSAKRASP